MNSVGVRGQRLNWPEIKLFGPKAQIPLKHNKPKEALITIVYERKGLRKKKNKKLRNETS